MSAELFKIEMNMPRMISAALAGAVVVYIWNMLAWMALPIHAPTINQLPDEQALIDTLRAQNLETGVYVAPFAADAASMSDPESAFMKNHRAGPIFSIYLRQEGTEPMGVSVLLGGFAIDVLAAALAVCLLSSLGPCSNSYGCRVGFVAGLGVFTAIVGHLSYWNWMYFPLDYTIAFMIDVTVGWALAGLAIAALVRPKASDRKQETGSSPASKPTAQMQSPATAKPEPKKPQPPARNDAISLLATLQREARFIDIVKEPLGEYSDAQVGAAARDVLRDCGVALDRLFKIQPVLQEEDGAQVELPAGATAMKIKLTGNASEDTKSGTLVHHGWEAHQCELPKWNGSQDLAMVIAQAEVEAK